MTPEFIVSFAEEAIMLTILIAMPMLELGLIVGLLESIFQAVTSIQEMTLMFVPKILAVFLGMVFFAPWMLEKMIRYTEKVIVDLPLYIR